MKYCPRDNPVTLLEFVADALAIGSIQLTSHLQEKP